MTDMLRFNIQVYLTGHNTEERDLKYVEVVIIWHPHGEK